MENYRRCTISQLLIDFADLCEELSKDKRNHLDVYEMERLEQEAFEASINKAIDKAMAEDKEKAEA